MKKKKEKDPFWDLINIKKPYPACYHCGYCCNVTPCWVSRRLKKVDKDNKCMLLTKKGEQYFCEAAKNPELKKELYQGEGCCSPMNSLRHEIIRKGNKSLNLTNNDKRRTKIKKS